MIGIIPYSSKSNFSRNEYPIMFSQNMYILHLNCISKFSPKPSQNQPTGISCTHHKQISSHCSKNWVKSQFICFKMLQTQLYQVYVMQISQDNLHVVVLISNIYTNLICIFWVRCVQRQLCAHHKQLHYTVLRKFWP